MSTSAMQTRYRAPAALFVVLLALASVVVAERPARGQQPGQSHEALVSEASGFAAGVTGGAAGGQYTVTTLDDAGPGSLREAVSSPAPLWIRFAVSGRIGLESSLLVQPDKTIDGRGARVEIAADRDVTGMYIGSGGLPASNVIVTNLVFVGGPATRQYPPEPQHDAITIQNGSDNVWIHRNTLTGWGDELVGIPWARNVTLSWNRFHDQVQATGAGMGHAIAAGNEASWAHAPEIRLTVAHNYFTNIPDRSPRTGHGAWAHVYNNYVEGWHYHGMSAVRGIDKFGPSSAGQLYAERNIFQPRFVAATGETSLRAIRAIVDATNAGLVKTSGNLLNGATEQQNMAGSVFIPTYRYEAVTATTGLRDTLISGSGWRDLRPPVSDDVTPPSVRVVQPAPGATVSGVVTVRANASDNFGVNSVEFFVEGQSKGTDTTAPYDFDWDTTAGATGAHRLSARAVDVAGNLATSSDVTVTVVPPPDTTPPTVGITQPQPSATVSGVRSVTAQASDNVGVTSVVFDVDGQLRHADGEAPYEFAWDTTAEKAGPYRLTARALDAAGNEGTSAPVDVTVVDTTPPSPPTGLVAGETSPGQVQLSWQASEDRNGVAGYDVYRDGTKLARATATSYTDTSPRADTSHTYTVRAVDSAGNASAPSDSVSVTTAPPALAVSDVRVTEGAKGTTKAARVTIRLSRASSRSVAVSWATANGTATAPGDYRSVVLTATSIPAGSTTKAVSVTVVGDRLREPSETFFVDLSQPARATIVDSRGVGTIANDD